LKIYNRYIVSLALAAGLVNILLTTLGQNDLSVYFIINTIVYLVITLLYVYFNPRARKALNTISIVLFAGFMVIVTISFVELMLG
jgi:hypothetical protein|tara:strand:+ start:156 stop:410 length:255 start_codon:yes stop_codon:yes gene_type:complete